MNELLLDKIFLSSLLTLLMSSLYIGCRGAGGKASYTEKLIVVGVLCLSLSAAIACIFGFIWI